MSKSSQHMAIVYLLIINLIGSVFMPSLASAMGSESRVLLCTSDGYQWVTLEAAQDLQLIDYAEAGEHCVACLSSDDDLEPTVLSYITYILVPAEVVFLTGTDSTIFKDQFFSTRQSRAPPFFI